MHASPLGGMLRKGTGLEVGADFVRVGGREIGGEQAALFVGRLLAKTDFLKEVERLDDTTLEAVSGTSAVWPVLGCLRAAERFVGAGTGAWLPSDDKQREFMDIFSGHIPTVDVLEERVGCLESRADSDIAPLNRWLRERGFTIELTVDPGSEGFAVASILDVLCEWLERGTRRTIEKAGASYDAVRLDEGVSLVQHPDLHDHPVVRIAAKGGYRVCMTVASGMPPGDFGLHSKVRSLRFADAPDYRYEGVVFPMVSYDRHEDISFLCGLVVRSGGKGWHVAEAVQQTRFRMNETGARAESAAAMSFRCSAAGAARPPYVLDRPFILWIEREDFPIPLFTAVFAEDSWKDPGNLDDVKVG